MKKRSLRAPFFFARFFSAGPSWIHRWLASDGGITVGAKLEFDLTIQVQKRPKISPDLYPVHHLIS
ncbi:hypothetical protein [Pseudomonas moorei]|uniref:hypothetical protein n=1 Tax=Pseudomonas moorei TaxID=395599 RepID=UPI0036F3B73E